MPIYSFKVDVFYRMVKMIMDWQIKQKKLEQSVVSIFSCSFCLIMHKYNLRVPSEHLQHPGTIYHVILICPFICITWGLREGHKWQIVQQCKSYHFQTVSIGQWGRDRVVMLGLSALFTYPNNVQGSWGQQETERVESSLLTLLPSAHSTGEEQWSLLEDLVTGFQEKNIKTY